MKTHKRTMQWIKWAKATEAEKTDNTSERNKPKILAKEERLEGFLTIQAKEDIPNRPKKMLPTSQWRK